MFDLDHFKNINDVHGHLVGDQVLVRVAERMSGLVRSTDSLFRWGGEEFLLLCPGTGAEALELLLHKLRDELACGEWSDLVGTAPVTASFGAAIMPAHGATTGALLLAADAALYRAKAAGRNQVVMATAQDCAPTDLPSAAA
jgi:diguanylate cyclase (GGDEF)-like protein